MRFQKTITPSRRRLSGRRHFFHRRRLDWRRARRFCFRLLLLSRRICGQAHQGGRSEREKHEPKNRKEETNAHIDNDTVPEPRTFKGKNSKNLFPRSNALRLSRSTCKRKSSEFILRERLVGVCNDGEILQPVDEIVKYKYTSGRRQAHYPDSKIDHQREASL